MNCYKSFKYLKQFKALNCCYSLCYSDDWFHLGKKTKTKAKPRGGCFLKGYMISVVTHMAKGMDWWTGKRGFQGQ